MSHPKSPVVNPYAKKSAAMALQNDMAPQSQQRISLVARSHRMASNNNGGIRKKLKAGDQATLFGERAFDPVKDCEVCRAKQQGQAVHRAHHQRCNIR